MEGYNSGFENPFSTPEVDKKKDDSEKSKETKKSPFFSSEKRKDDAKKIAESLDKSSLFSREKSTDDTPNKQPELRHLHEAEPADETAAPTESIGEHESVEITKELAAARRQELETEAVALEASSEDGDVTSIVVSEAAETFLQKVEASGDIDAAAHETATELGLAESEIGDEPSAETAENAPVDMEEGEILLGAVDAPEHIEATNDSEDDPAVTVGTATPVGSGGGRRGGGGSGTRGGGPAGPVPPHGSGGPLGGGPGTPAAASGVRYNTWGHPMLYSAPEVAYYEKRAEHRGLLVGGIVGYLIGRRRGRIKTEKRLIPVQKRLEKQVKTIQEQLYDQEFALRQLAREKAAVQKPERVVRGVTPPERAKQPQRPETRIGLAKPAHAEQLGRVLVQAEAVAPTAPELRQIVPEQVKTMSRQEVLQIGEKIQVEGTTLRDMYESHLLGEQGMRRVVVEYLRGHNVVQALKQELVEREIDFERDPILRDKAYREMQESHGGESSLEHLLHKAGVDASTDHLSTVVKQLQTAQEENLRRESRQRKLVDTAMITLIVILATIITIILFSK